MNMGQVMLFLKGAITTIELTLLSMFVGTFFGLLVSLGRISKNKILNKITWIYVWIFRGTPLLLQIMIVYLAIPLMAIEFTGSPINMTRFVAASIALVLNTAAYLAEIFRAGILSIDKGQMEACKALGMNYHQAMIKVIIPQTYRRVIPPYSNEFIMILKDTSLVSAIGLGELYRASEKLSSATGDWRYLFIAAGGYLFLTTISTYLFDKMEKKASIFI